MSKPFTYFSVCSGIEAATSAWEPLGWKAVGFSEIEEFPAAVLAHHYPHIKNYGDLTKFKEWNLKPGSVKLLVGGTPCQAFSIAGLRKGIEDPRGNLALTFLSLANEVKPEWILWENVPGCLSSNGGRDFSSFIGALAKFGYGFAWRVLDAQFVGRCKMHPQGRGWDGVPQRRRRVFLVASLRGWEAAAKVLFEPESLCRDFEESRKKRKATTSIVKGVSGKDRQWPSEVTSPLDASFYHKQGLENQHIDRGATLFVPFDQGKDVIWSASDQAKCERSVNITGTLTCSRGQRGGYVAGELATANSITVHPLPVKLRQLFDGSVPFTFKVRGIGFETGSNGGKRDMRRYGGSGFLGADNLAFTLCAEKDFFLAVPNVSIYENHPNDSRVTGPFNVAPTITSRFGTGGGNVPFVQSEIQEIKKHIEVEPMMFKTASLCYPINSFSMRGRADLRNDLRMTMGVGNDGDPQFTLGACNSHAVGNELTVRRLTPLECERLQGFNDNHTMIAWRGKAPSECPDGLRYKAIGNSMAVPCMRWIAKRIQNVDNELNS